MTRSSRATARIRLSRRGVDHGSFSLARHEPNHSGLELQERKKRWTAAEPLVFRSLVSDVVERCSDDLVATTAALRRVRSGEYLSDEFHRRLAGSKDFRAAGTSTDLGDDREIEKVIYDAVRGNRVLAAELWAKVSWVSTDERDQSLRIRFSYGSETLRSWLEETRRAPWSDRYAEAVFPESAALGQHQDLLRLVGTIVGRKVRLSERIVYANAPGGGAAFHHDDEPGQSGVAYSQLQGSTAWFALPFGELARELVGYGGRRKHSLDIQDAEEMLENGPQGRIERLLNRTPSFTKRLAEQGRLFVLEPGDVLLMPSNGPRSSCWHSVFALGKTPSLAHSYGIFPLRRPSARPRAAQMPRAKKRTR